MPPKTKKRAIAEVEGNEQPASRRGKKNKTKKSAPAERENAEPNQGSGDNATDNQQSDSEGEDVMNRAPFAYYCFTRPLFDRERENNAKDKDDQLDEGQIIDAYNKDLSDKTSLGDKPAADWTRRATYTNPDNFDLHIYNDFHDYGIHELIENLLVAFDSEFKKTKRDEDNLRQMWAAVAGLIHWLSQDSLESWMWLEDGERMELTLSLIGRAFLTCLNELDRANLLNADSEIKDLGQVMAVYLWWSCDLDEGEDFQWRKEIPAYAKKAGIDLSDAGYYGIKKQLDGLDEEHSTIGVLEGAAKADRWAWKKNWNEYKSSLSGLVGGEEYNILRMTSKERASHNFDNKDPLKGFPAKDLREGNLMLG